MLSCLGGAGGYRIPLPPLYLEGGLFPAVTAPWDALVCAVLLASVTCSAHGLEVLEVMVWFTVTWGDDVIYCPVTTLELFATD
jgi:hypothetical protein